MLWRDLDGTPATVALFAISQGRPQTHTVDRLTAAIKRAAWAHLRRVHMKAYLPLAGVNEVNLRAIRPELVALDLDDRA